MGVDVIAAHTPGRDRDSDSFSDLTEEDRDAFRSAGIDIAQLADPGTFWGWERWQLVREVCPGEIADPVWSEIGLEWVPNDKVQDIARAFERCDAGELLQAAGASDRLEPRVVHGLAKFFRVAADRGLGLIYWY